MKNAVGQRGGFAHKWSASLVVLILIWQGLGGLGAQPSPVTQTYRQAYDAGHRDGRAAGLTDRGEDRLYDFANKREFQRADVGFDPSLHERDVYVVAYRRGFQDGYEEGYGLNTPEPSAPPSAIPPARDIPPALNPARSPLARTTLAAGTRIRVELLDTLSTHANDVGDVFRAQVIRDVEVAGQKVVPRATQLQGTISFLKRAGRVRGRAKLNLRFERFKFLDGRVVAIEAKVVDIEDQSEEKLTGEEGTIVAGASKGDDAKSVGTTSAIGALVGVLTGGGKGAGVGATAGAVAGLAKVLVTRGRDAQLESRTQLTIELLEPVEISGG